MVKIKINFNCQTWFCVAINVVLYCRLCDMRASALCDRHAKLFEEPEDPMNRSFFSEIISSISDVKLSNNGRYMISRDYLSVKVWDLHMESKPIETYPVSILTKYRIYFVLWTNVVCVHFFVKREKNCKLVLSTKRQHDQFTGADVTCFDSCSMTTLTEKHELWSITSHPL